MKTKLSRWADENFTPESRPSPSTLRTMAADGRIPGATYDGKRWWVDTLANNLQADLDSAVSSLPLDLRNAVSV